MAHTLTVNLNSGKTLTLKQIANVKVITDDAVINTTARNHGPKFLQYWPSR
ncbi:hypothetical protein [Loigolactobacillus backii]|uniref:hypothetical protein n=1 Tax=Loigolactobacillus backii TaxID=375175 RepID=UPI000B31A694|nr:hypothetical protein [Loigolactobacillus backii]